MYFVTNTQANIYCDYIYRHKSFTKTLLILTTLKFYFGFKKNVVVTTKLISKPTTG